MQPRYRRRGNDYAELRMSQGAIAGMLGVRVTPTKPRHAWTTAPSSVQKTILHEHWRIAFRRQYFTGCRALQGTLGAFCASTTSGDRTAAVG
jgi:hypothetical protein